MGRIVLGLDVGQKQDPTAIAVVEVIPRDRRQGREELFVVRDLGRLPLGTPYPVVAQEVAAVIDRLNRQV